MSSSSNAHFRFPGAENLVEADRRRLQVSEREPTVCRRARPIAGCLGAFSQRTRLFTPSTSRYDVSSSRSRRADFTFAKKFSFSEVYKEPLKRCQVEGCLLSVEPSLLFGNLE